MSESLPYLGIATANSSNIVTNPLISELIRGMRFYNAPEVTGTHRVPSIVCRDPAVVHPAIGARGKEYAGFAYVPVPFVITGERASGDRIWTPGCSDVDDDELRIMLYPAETARHAGIPAYQPEHVTAEDEANVHKALIEGVGYGALSAQAGPALEDGTRYVELFGVREDGVLDALPINSKVASIFMGQVCHVLRHDLSRQFES